MILRKLREWECRFIAKHGLEPKVVSVTKEEMAEIQSTLPYTVAIQIQENRASKVFGMDVDTTYYAPQIRTVQLEKSYIRLTEEANMSLALDYEAGSRMRRHITAEVLSESTGITVTIESNPLFRLKQKYPWLRKWFPILTKKVLIEGKVLYPYLKHTLLHNKHVIKFHDRSS